METQSLPETPQIDRMVRATSSSELAELLRDASRDDTPVIPVGGGTALHTGNVTTDGYLGIDTRGMSGVREYHPTDLTASFWAGTTLAEVRAVLDEHGQELPVDMVAVDIATIGGMVATGFAGPRRLGSGTLKDLIIGVELVRGDGLVAKAGGMLVKNVSGFEIPRFLHGSWGALAVIAAINLKVIPKPKSDVTFVQHESSLGTSLAGQLRLLRQHPGAVAVVTERKDDGWAMAVRLMGRRPSVDAQIQLFREDLGTQTEVRDGEAPWVEYNERWAEADGDVRIVVGGRAETIHRLALELSGMTGLRGLSVSLGTGTLRVAVDAEAASRREILSRFASYPVTWTVESAPAPWRGQDTVWGPTREDRALSLAIKDQFDPAHILNRGRLFI